MKCPVCIEEGEKSTLRDLGGSSTLMYYAPYYDEDGVYHHHDGNMTSSMFACSRGHTVTIARSGSCHCGWGKNEKPKVTVYRDDERHEVTDPKVLASMGL